MSPVPGTSVTTVLTATERWALSDPSRDKPPRHGRPAPSARHAVRSGPSAAAWGPSSLPAPERRTVVWKQVVEEVLMTSQTTDQRTTATPATTLVQDVMNTRVISVAEGAGYKDIVTLLRRHRVSAVPVLDAAGRVIGVVSEADLLMKQTAPALPVGAVRLAWR